MTRQFPDVPDSPKGVFLAPLTASDRFQLLSAYLDDEVTPQERRQVQVWLDTDPQFKQTYLNLLRLQRAIPELPSPPPSISAAELSQRVLSQIHRDNRRQQYWRWGSIAVAVGLGMVTSLCWEPLRTFIPGPQQAQGEPPEYLMIALNQPLFDVPTETH